jgi:hypothetical protein
LWFEAFHNESTDDGDGHEGHGAWQGREAGLQGVKPPQLLLLHHQQPHSSLPDQPWLVPALLLPVSCSPSSTAKDVPRTGEQAPTTAPHMLWRCCGPDVALCDAEFLAAAAPQQQQQQLLAC